MMHTFLFKMYLITLLYPIFILLPYVGAYYLQLYECIACSDMTTGLIKDYEICHELLPEMQNLFVPERVKRVWCKKLVRRKSRKETIKKLNKGRRVLLISDNCTAHPPEIRITEFKHKLCDCAKKKNVEPRKGNCWLNSCIERKLIFEIMICSEMDKLSETMNKMDKRKYTQFLECLFRAKKKFCELKKPYYPCATLC